MSKKIFTANFLHFLHQILWISYTIFYYPKNFAVLHEFFISFLLVFCVTPIFLHQNLVIFYDIILHQILKLRKQ